MPDQDELIKIAADLGSTEQQMRKLESLFEDTATGISSFIDATARMDDTGKKLEVTLSGINKSFEQVVKTITIGPRGGVQNLESLTAASGDLATGFNLLFDLAKRFETQLGNLGSEIKSVRDAISGSAQAQIKAAQDADKAEADLAKKRRERNNEIRNLVTAKAQDQLGGIPAEATRAEITNFQNAIRDVVKSISEETRLPGGRENAIDQAFQQAKLGAVQTQGALGKVQQSIVALIASYENLGTTAAKELGKAQDAADKQSERSQKNAALEAAKAAQQELQNQLKEIRNIQSSAVGTVLRTQFQAPEGTSEVNAARLEIPIKRFQELAQQGKLEINELINSVQKFATTGELDFDNLNVRAASLLRQLVAIDEQLKKQALKTQGTAASNTADIAKAQVEEVVRQIRDVQSAAVGNVLRAQFQAPASASETSAARLEVPIKRFQELTLEGKIEVDALITAVQKFASTGEISFDGINSRASNLLRQLITIDQQLATQAQKNNLQPLINSITRTDNLVAELQQRFSVPLLQAGLPTDKIDFLITKLALLSKQTQLTEQQIRQLFNAINVQGALPSIASGLTAEQQKLIPTIVSIQKLFSTLLDNQQKTVDKQAEFNTRVQASKPIVDQLVATFNKGLNPSQVIGVQNALNTLFNQVGKGTLDLQKLQTLAGNFIGGGGGGGGGGRPPLRFLPPDEGGREQAALLNLINLFQRTGSEGQKSANSIFLSWQNVIRIFQVQTVHTFFGQFISDIRQSADHAREFQLRISEIRTISQDNQLSTVEWARGLRELSDAFGLPILDVTKAAYDAISNQVTRGAQTFEFLRKTLQFSLVTVSSATDAQNLLSSAIKSFGENNLTASKAADSLFKLIDLGRVTASEISNIFGRVAQLASQAGISIDELGAALATLTVQGVKPNEAFTLLNNLLLKLLKPTPELTELFGKFGFSTGEAALQSLKLVGVFRLLNKELESGGLARIGELEGNIRAIRGAVAISSGDPLADFEKNLERFKNQSEQFANASKIVNESAGRELTRQLNEIKNIFTVDVGDQFLNAIIRLTAPFGGLTGIVKTTVELMKEFLDTINKLATPIINISVALASFFKTDIVGFIKAATEAFVAFYAAQIAGKAISLASNAAVILINSGLTDLRSAINETTIATEINTNSTGKNTLSLRLQAAATKASAYEAALLQSTMLGVTTIIGLAAFAYLRSAQASNEFNESLKRQREESKKLREEAASEERERNRQNAVDSFKARNDSIFKNASNLIAEVNRKATALLDDLNKINVVGLKGLEQTLRGTFKEFEKKLTPFEQLKNILGELEKSQKRVIAVNAEAQRKAFEDSLAGIDVSKQVPLILAEVDRLRAQIAAKLNENRGIGIIPAESLDEARKTFDELTRILDRYSNNLNNALKSQQKLVADLKVKNETKAFEDSLIGKDPEQQDQLIFNRVEQLRKQAFDLFRKGDLEESRRKFDEIDRLLAKITEKERSFREKAGKAGFNFGEKTSTDDLARRNEQDRLNLEIALQKQLEQQIRQKDELEKKGLQEKNALEQQYQALQQKRIADALKAEQDKQIAQQKEVELQNLRKNLEDRFGAAQSRRNDAQNRISEAGKNQNKQLEEQFNAFNKLTGGGPQKIGDREIPAPQKSLEELKNLLAQVQANPNQSNIEAFITKLSNVKGDLEKLNERNNAGFLGRITEEQVTTQKRIEDFYTGQLLKINQIIEAKKQQAQAEKDIVNIQGEQDKVKDALGKLPKAQPIPGTEPIVSGLQDFNNKFQTQLTDFSKGMDNLVRILNDLNGPNINPPRRALGGPIGTDTHLFWGNPSEFIVNANSSQRFAPQLRAINMGFDPSNITNISNSNKGVNVGDIHVNVQGGTTESVTARKLGNEIRREIRRGTLRQ